MDLDTDTWVCPPCSDPAGLRPGGKGSLGHPCLGSEAPLGGGSSGWPQRALGTGWLVEGRGWADQQQESGMRLGKGGTSKPSLNGPLAGSRAWGVKTEVPRTGKGIKSPLRP